MLFIIVIAGGLQSEVLLRRSQQCRKTKKKKREYGTSTITGELGFFVSFVSLFLLCSLSDLPHLGLVNRFCSFGTSEVYPFIRFFNAFSVIKCSSSLLFLSFFLGN